MTIYQLPAGNARIFRAIIRAGGSVLIAQNAHFLPKFSIVLHKFSNIFEHNLRIWSRFYLAWSAQSLQINPQFSCFFL